MAYNVDDEGNVTCYQGDTVYIEVTQEEKESQGILYFQLRDEKRNPIGEQIIGQADIKTDITQSVTQFSATCTMATFIEQVERVAGQYIFTYNGTNWVLDDSEIILADYGITVTGLVVANDIIEVDLVLEASITQGLDYSSTVDAIMFAEKVSDVEGQYIFIYDGTDWKLNDVTVDLAEYGIEVTGTIVEGDTLEVDLSENINTVITDVRTLTITCDRNVFAAKVGNVQGSYEFDYDGSDWTLNGEAIVLTEYGLTVSQAVSGDTFTITLAYSSELIIFTIPATLTDLLTVPKDEDYAVYYYGIKSCTGDVEDTLFLGNNGTFGTLNTFTVYPKKAEGV